MPIVPAHPGTEVGIGYDWTGPLDHAPEEGEFLRTPTGRCYLIVSLRRVRSKVAPCRFKIRALVIEEAELTPGERVIEMRWNRR